MRGARGSVSTTVRSSTACESPTSCEDPAPAGVRDNARVTTLGWPYPAHPRPLSELADEYSNLGPSNGSILAIIESVQRSELSAPLAASHRCSISWLWSSAFNRSRDVEHDKAHRYPSTTLWRSQARVCCCPRWTSRLDRGTWLPRSATALPTANPRCAPRGALLARGSERSSRQIPRRLVAEVLVDEAVSAEP